MLPAAAELLLPPCVDQYVAKLTGILPEDPLTAALADQAYFFCEDVWQTMWVLSRRPNLSTPAFLRSEHSCISVISAPPLCITANDSVDVVPTQLPHPAFIVWNDLTAHSVHSHPQELCRCQQHNHMPYSNSMCASTGGTL